MKKFIYVLVACFVLTPEFSSADDIEVYLQSKPESKPMLMLMLDYRPSLFGSLCKYSECSGIMSAEAYSNLQDYLTQGGTVSVNANQQVSRYEIFVAVLEEVIEHYSDIYIGLMVSNFNNGGTIISGYQELQEGDANGAKTALVAKLREVPVPSNSSSAHKLQPSETFYEWYRYLTGGAVIYGKETTGNFDSSNPYDPLDPPVPEYDWTIIDDPNRGAPANYIDPFDDANVFACTNLFAMVMAMNVANQDDDLDADVAADFNTDAAVKFEDMLEYLSSSDTDLVSEVEGTQNVLTWVISDSGSLGSSPDWAAAGGTGDGVLDLSDPSQLEADLNEAFTEVISVSSTFVASSVPVNVFNRTESLDNLYIALFEAQATIDWPGNLKKLHLVDTDSDGVFDDIRDVNGISAFEVDGDDIGRIRTEALTYWTLPGSLPDPDPDKSEVSGKDGRSVARGGAGQIIPGFISGGPGNSNSDTDSRQLFIEPLSGSALQAFNEIGSSPSAEEIDRINELLDIDYSSLPTGGSGYRQSDARSDANDLIYWSRGQDVDDVDGDNAKTEARSWILGASIHSRPLALNYGTRDGYSTSNPNILLMMGTNDGYFHIFQNTLTDGTESGKELFAFMPREFLSVVDDFRTNSQVATKMIYGVDGEPTSLVVDNDNDGNIESADNDKAYIYFGLRRGGKSYYALDVSDPDIATTTPPLLWKITNTDTDFTELGLTFSTPITTKVKYLDHATDVVVFAGGYNGGWDSTYTNRIGKDLGDADDTVGNAIYIVDAQTGTLLWKVVQGTGSPTNTVFQHADMADSVPSTVTPVDSNGNSITDRLYVGDTGGAVWRVDLPENNKLSDDPDYGDHREDNWFVTKFAELGTDGLTTDRRFFHEPDVVLTFDANGNYDGILISSGDRAHPLEENVTNYLFYLKDRLTVSGDTSVKARETDADMNGIGDGVLLLTDIPDVTTCLTGSEGSCVTNSQNGWRIELEGTGEKSLSKPLVDSGIAIFTSYTPTDAVSACDIDEGDGFAYVVNLADGTPVGDQRKYDLGPGIPAGAVAISGAILFPGGGIEADLTGASDDRTKVQKSQGKGRWLIYWRETGSDDL